MTIVMVMFVSAAAASAAAPTGPVCAKLAVSAKLCKIFQSSIYLYIFSVFLKD